MIIIELDPLSHAICGFSLCGPELGGYDVLRFSFVMSFSLNIVEFWSQYDHFLRLDRSQVTLPEAWITVSRIERINWLITIIVHVLPNNLSL